jgi:hypothetical protein
MDNAHRLETVGVDRRRLLTTTATGIAVVGAASLLPQNPAVATKPDDIRSFKVHMPDEQLVDLRRRLAATRWPDKETVADQSQGAPLASLLELVPYWATEYDWRRGEAKLNAFPRFKTVIDGVDIHFIHVRSRHASALPLIITHGWPGSVFEQIKPIGPLSDPTAYGGRAEDAFHVIVPSLPGYGFSSRPTEVGWDVERTADEVLDNFSLHWLTNTVSSGARLYWENRDQNLISAAAQKTDTITLPVAITTFPDDDLFRAPQTLGPPRLPQPDLLPRRRAGRPWPGKSPSSSHTSFAPRSGRFASLLETNNPTSSKETIS